MGPWSDNLLARFGITVPLGVKRGYHMHFKAASNAKLRRPVVDAEYGYVLSEMKDGVRLTTGAEFALRDAPPTPSQMSRVEPIARTLFPLMERIEPQPWLGARPFLPDLLPMIGQVPGHQGLWVNFGHHHLGFTTGPTTGRLLAEMITNASTFCRSCSISSRPVFARELTVTRPDEQSFSGHFQGVQRVRSPVCGLAEFHPRSLDV